MCRSKVIVVAAGLERCFIFIISGHETIAFVVCLFVNLYNNNYNKRILGCVYVCIQQCVCVGVCLCV